MNLKKVPFDTVWVPFPEIEAKAKEIGAEPTRILPNGEPLYTVPFMTIESSDGSKRVITDSLNIARYFDEKENDPSLTLFPKDTAVRDAIFSQWLRDKVGFKLIPIFLPSLRKALKPSEQQYFVDTRIRVFGVPYEKVAPQTDEELENAWKTAEEALTAFATILDQAGREGNHRISPRPTYAEIEFVSVLRVYKAYSSGDINAWPRMAKLNGGRWARLLEEPEYDQLESIYFK